VFELTPERRTALWWSGLEAMARVHRLDVSDPVFSFLPRPRRDVAPIDHELQYWDDYLSWGCPRARLPKLERALAWMRAKRPFDEPTAICWGDSRLANQIFEDCRCIAVIDWEMVFVGNPVADLGWWPTLDRCFSEGIGLPRAPGVPEAAETVARWEELVGRKALHFAYYELFAAFRFAAIMSRMGGQMKHYELLPADHDFDTNNLATTILGRVMEEIGVPGAA
jgi:aminoglycoside phosphotransferase (APT) family kinase protein